MLYVLCLQSRFEALELVALCVEDGEWGEDLVSVQDPFLKAFLEDSWDKEEWEARTPPPEPVGEATQEAPEMWDIPPLDFSSQLDIPSPPMSSQGFNLSDFAASTPTPDTSVIDLVSPTPSFEETLSVPTPDMSSTFEHTLSAATPGELTQLYVACLGEDDEPMLVGAPRPETPPISPIPGLPPFMSVESLLATPPRAQASRTSSQPTSSVDFPTINMADWSQFTSAGISAPAMDTLVQRGAQLPMQTNTPGKNQKVNF